MNTNTSRYIVTIGLLAIAFQPASAQASPDSLPSTQSATQVAAAPPAFANADAKSTALSKDFEPFAESKAVAYFTDHPDISATSSIDLSPYGILNGSAVYAAVVERIGFLVTAKRAGISGDYQDLLASKFDSPTPSTASALASDPSAPKPRLSPPVADSTPGGDPIAAGPQDDQGDSAAKDSTAEIQGPPARQTRTLNKKTQPDQTRDIAIQYLRRFPQRYSMVKLEDWLKENYGSLYENSMPDSMVSAIRSDVGLGQGLVNIGLQAKSPYFKGAFAYLKDQLAHQKAATPPEDNPWLATREAESALINSAVADFATGKALTELTNASSISAFEKSKGFTQGSLEELCQNFEKAMNRRAMALSKTVGVTADLKAKVAASNPGVGADTSTDTTQSAAAANSDNTTAAPAANTGNVSQYFQSTKLNVSNRATLVQEELVSGYMKLFGHDTFGYKIEGSLPVASSSSSSTSSSASTTSTMSSAPSTSSSSTADYVTAELLMYNGGLFNFWISPLQLAPNESPQGITGRQYESDRYYLSYYFHRKDSNGNPVLAQDRYDESSILVYLTDGIGMKGFQRTVGASTTSSSVPELSAAGEGYFGVGVDGPTFDGLTSKESGYISMQVVGGVEAANRNTVDQIFSSPSGVPMTNAQTVFETAEAKISYVDGSWTLSAFYTTPLDQHTRSFMRDAVGFSFSWNGKSTNPSSTSH